MKTLNALAVSALCMLSLAACNKPESSSDVAHDVSSAASEASSDTSEARKDAAADQADEALRMIRRLARRVIPDRTVEFLGSAEVILAPDLDQGTRGTEQGHIARDFADLKGD